jgi:alpha-tubulin suppressor-like RCC1 family protein
MNSTVTPLIRPAGTFSLREKGSTQLQYPPEAFAMKNPLHILISLAVALICLLPVSAQAIVVQSTSPAANESGVAYSAVITATFDQSPNPATLTTGSFTLSRTPGMVAIAGSVTYDNPTLTATFTPASPLPPGNYTATVTTAVTDSIGNPLFDNKVWTFDTIPAPAIAVFPLSLDFGTVGLNMTSAPRTVTVTNNGSQSLNINVSNTGTTPFDFSSPSTSFAIVAPGQAVMLTLSFAPSSLPAGAKSATLQITSNDPLTPTVDIPLSGTSVTSWQIFASANSNGAITCTPRVAEGGSATCVITPDANYVLSALSNDVYGLVTDLFPSVVNNRIVITNITANHSITASFALNQFTITSNTPTNGIISCSSPVLKNGTGTCTITPDANYRLSALTDTVNSVTTSILGQVSGTSLSIANVTANHLLNVTFEHNPINGVCGSDAGTASTTAPAYHLCTVGAMANFADAGAGTTVSRWSWDCSGQFTGSVTPHCTSNYHAPPVATPVSPASGAVNVSPAIPAITATFDQDMDPATVTSGSFTVSRKVTITKIIAQRYHTLAIKSDGGVVGWGDNEAGEITVPAEAQSGITDIAAGMYHSLALTSSGKVLAWGGNSYGQTTVPAGALTGVTAIAAGDDYSLALRSDGSVIGWGINNGGQITIPTEALSGVTAIAAGAWHTLALKNGKVLAWGANHLGQITVPLAAQSGVVAISAGMNQSMALTSTGVVVSWGYDAAVPVPAEVLAGGVTAIAAGGDHRLALKNGAVLAWGSNGSGETTVPAEATNGVVAIAAGQSFSLALKSNGSVVGWGYNSFGQITVPVTSVTGLSAIASGESHNLGLKFDGTVVTWGFNGQKQLNFPPGLSGVTSLSAGVFHNLALKKDGTVVEWGYNNLGQTSVPIGLAGVKAVAAGAYHSLALKSDNTVVAWGDNTYLQAPTPVPITNVTAIAAGLMYSLALLGDKTVVAWGDNRYKQLDIPPGLSDVIAISANHLHSLALTSGGTVVEWGSQDYFVAMPPVPADLNNVVAVAAGGTHSLALKNDGTVVAWGDNVNGQTDVPAGLADVEAISAGYAHSMALKRDGSVVVWGSNFYGEGIVPFSIYDTPISGSVSYDAGTRTATFTPSAPLPPGATFAVTVNTGVKTMDGYHPLTDTTWTFSTQGGSRIAASPSTKDFGSVVVNQPAVSTAVFTRAADTATVLISNSGSAPLTASLATVGTDSSQFLVAPGGGKVIGWSDSFSPTIPVELLSGVVAIAAGGSHALALKSDGSVVAWGIDYYGDTIVPATADSGVSAISAGKQHSLALKNGAVFTWGSPLFNLKAIPPEASSGVSAISAGAEFNLALKNGAVLAWGANHQGQTVVPSEALADITAISAGVVHGLALTSGGKVVAWGGNSSGQTAVPAEATTGVTAIAAGYDHSMALVSGKVLSWGWLGQTEVPAEALSGVIAISAGDNFSMALKSNGTVIAWGDNTFGQTAVPAISDITSIAAGYYFGLALKNNGSGYVCPSTTPTVAPGTACTATVTFKPTSTGAKSAALRISSNDPLAPTTDIPLSGIGQYLNITFSLGANGLALLGSTSQPVPYGGTISSVSAFPATDYHFTDWTGNGGFVTNATNPLPDFSAMADMAISANFTHDLVNGACGYTPLQVLAMTAPAAPCSSGQVGTISGNGSVGSPWSWQCNGQYGGTNSTACTALIKTYSVTFNGNGGSLAGTANQTINHGANATPVSVLPASGYSLHRWTTPAGFSSTSNPLTVSNVTADMPLTANFAVNAVTNLQAAYNTAAGNGTGAIHLLATGTIPAGSGAPSELIAASPVEVVLSGGYNASYSSKSGLSVVTGAVKVRNGKVIADGVAIRP